MLHTVSKAASSDASAPLRVIGRPWSKGESGNPNGRPKSPVDIAELARQHGPRCIQVAAELLEDPDPRIRLAALVALLDRGFGRPAQTVNAQDNAQSITFMHLVAARASSDELNRSRLIEGDAVATTTDRETIPVDLSVPALE
jgi:hypothetical protein